MSANSRQVGGDHYSSTYIHWDFVLRTGMGYLEGNATKYISRYDKKGKPLEDLEKALHYVEKLRENAVLCARKLYLPKLWLDTEAQRFCDANDIRGPARLAIFDLTLWETESQISRAAYDITLLIGRVSRGEPPLPGFSKPVPLDDSNKHADRSES